MSKNKRVLAIKSLKIECLEEKRYYGKERTAYNMKVLFDRFFVTRISIFYYNSMCFFFVS